MKVKTLILAIVCALGCATAFAADNYSYDVKVLPTAAQTALSTHFPKHKVNHIKIDKGVFGVDSYDVVLSDGTEVEFDAKGNISEVDCARGAEVPASIVMASIRNYVAKNYPKQKIVKYDVKRNGYEVELTSGIDLEFNAQGAFKRIDR